MLCGRRLVADLALLELREIVEKHPALGLVRFVRDPRHQELAQLHPPRADAVDAVERAHRLGVSRILADDLPQLRDGALGVSEALASDARDRAAKPKPLALPRLLEPTRERVREAIPRPRALGGRPELLAHRVALGRELPSLELAAERRLRVVQMDARDLTHPREQRDALVHVLRADRREHDLVEGGQAAPLLVLLVDRDQAAGGALVGRVGREHPLVAPERAVRLTDLVLVDGGRA